MMSVGGNSRQVMYFTRRTSVLPVWTALELDSNSHTTQKGDVTYWAFSSALSSHKQPSRSSGHTTRRTRAATATQLHPAGAEDRQPPPVAALPRPTPPPARVQWRRGGRRAQAAQETTADPGPHRTSPCHRGCNRHAHEYYAMPASALSKHESAEMLSSPGGEEASTVRPEPALLANWWRENLTDLWWGACGLILDWGRSVQAAGELKGLRTACGARAATPSCASSAS